MQRNCNSRPCPDTKSRHSKKESKNADHHIARLSGNVVMFCKLPEKLTRENSLAMLHFSSYMETGVNKAGLKSGQLERF